MRPSKIRNISKIVDNGLCNGCGACYSVCQEEAISIEENKRLGILFAKIAKEKCINCGNCLLVCPALDIQVNNNVAKNKVIGNYTQLLCGHSSNHDLRYRASSGGIISALLEYLIEKRIVEGFVLVKPSNGNPFLNEPFISNQVNEIHKYAGTRYLPIPIDKILKEISSRAGKYVVIGTPCQIYGLTKYEKVNGEIKDKIYLKVGFFCGGTPNLNAYRYYMFANRIKEENLISIHRGLGWPGNDVFEYADGKKILKARKPKDFYARSNYTLCFYPIFAQKRCLLCIDRYSSFADVSVGDAWLERFRDDSEGTSLIISRSKKVDQLLSEMRQHEYICYASIGEDEVMRAQRIFSDYYHNAYTTYKILLRKKFDLNLVAEKNQINSFWSFKLLLITLGMKLSEYRPLWKFLFIYGIFFRYANRFINHAANMPQFMRRQISRLHG